MILAFYTLLNTHHTHHARRELLFIRLDDWNFVNASDYFCTLPAPRLSSLYARSYHDPDPDCVYREFAAFLSRTRKP